MRQQRGVQRLREGGILPGGAAAASYWGEGLTHVASGEWERGLATMRKAEYSPLPSSARIAAARMAVIGSWLGAVPLPHADSIYRSVVAQPLASADRANAIELVWMDGVLGAVARDDARVRGAMDRLAGDTAGLARYAARAVRGFAAELAAPGGGIDSLTALTERVIQDSSAK